MNISVLARRAGISASGVRWYESAGILPPPARAPNGYRAHTDADLSRLQLILTLRRLGLAPTDAGRLAQRCIDGGGDIGGDLGATLDAQRRAITRQREELERAEVELGDLETTIAAAAGRRGGSVRDRISVLFICNGNSARSQIAEVLLGRFGGDEFEAQSAGTRPKSLHPLAVRVLTEVGIDWSGHRAKSFEELRARRFDYLISLSDSAREACPELPGPHSSLHWHLDDPAPVEGTEEERLDAFRATRTELSLRLRPFIEIARRAAGHVPPIAAAAAR